MSSEAVWDEVRDEYGDTLVNDCGPVYLAWLYACMAVGDAQTHLRYGETPHRDAVVAGQLEAAQRHLNELARLLGSGE